MGVTGNKYGHVLLVDDSEIDVLVNRRLIELTAFADHTTIVHSGEHALHFLMEECPSAEKAPDWIFLDVNLPMMDGLEFLDHFLQLPSFIREKSRILILTVFQKPEVLEKLRAHPNVYGQVEKPLTQEVLKSIADLSSVKTGVSF